MSFPRRFPPPWSIEDTGEPNNPALAHSNPSSSTALNART